jgi:hypothetical protein
MITYIGDPSGLDHLRYFGLPCPHEFQFGPLSDSPNPGCLRALASSSCRGEQCDSITGEVGTFSHSLLHACMCHACNRQCLPGRFSQCSAQWGIIDPLGPPRMCHTTCCVLVRRDPFGPLGGSASIGCSVHWSGQKHVELIRASQFCLRTDLSRRNISHLPLGFCSRHRYSICFASVGSTHNDLNETHLGMLFKV